MTAVIAVTVSSATAVAATDRRHASPFLTFSKAKCPVSPTGVIGRNHLNQQSPMVVNSVGAVGSGQDVAACVAWVDAATGQRTVSAPIFVYADISDEQPRYVISSGSLWVYDSLTTRGAVLVRLSIATHRVVQRLSMPAFVRPTIAGDVDGFWFGQGEETQSSADLLYFVGPSSSRPTPMIEHAPNRQFIGKICVAGASAWIEETTPGSFTSTGYLINRPGAVPETMANDPYRECPGAYETFGVVAK
jgi:hypothetical protein